MADNNNSKEKSEVNNEGFNIWQEILNESTIKKDYEEVNIFVFGDKDTGKKSLIRIMNREAASLESEMKKTLNIEEEGMKYGLMNYSHLTVKKNGEEDLDTVNKIGVWIMNELIDEDTFLTLIKPKDMINSICLIVVDYSTPWTIKKSLEKWTDFIYKSFGKLIIKFPFDFQKEIRKKSKKIYLYIFLFIFFK
jgi:hypothetical protein